MNNFQPNKEKQNKRAEAKFAVSCADAWPRTNISKVVQPFLYPTHRGRVHHYLSNNIL